MVNVVHTLLFSMYVLLVNHFSNECKHNFLQGSYWAIANNPPDDAFPIRNKKKKYASQVRMRTTIIHRNYSIYSLLEFVTTVEIINNNLMLILAVLLQS